MGEPVTNNVCLAIEGLTKRFGGFYALNELNMDVTHGHIHALIGPNGAGKTTFFNLLTGVLAADTGRIVFDGQMVDDARPSRRTLQGHRPHLPEHPAVSASDGAGDRHDRRALPLLSVGVEGARRCRAAASVRRGRRGARDARQRASSCSNFSASPTSATPRPPTCPTANSASWKWRARSPRSRGCCCWTSRRPA